MHRLQFICRSEGFHADQGILRDVIEANNGDIRHVLNTLQMWKFQYHTVSQQSDKNKIWQIEKDKTVRFNAQGVAKIMLNNQEFNSIKTFNSKLSMFFINHDLVPLYVHENYLTSMCNSNSMDSIEKMAKSADMMSRGDIVYNQTKQFQDWSLMPSIGIL